MRLVAVTAFAATLAAASAAAAQTPAASGTTADAHCLLAMVALSNSDDQTAQRVGQDGIVFYAGRIAAQDPNFDFGKLKSMATGLQPQTVQTELQQRCGPMLQKVMRQLEAALAPPPGAAPPAGAKPATPPK